MAESDGQEKTEQPTAKKLDEARKKGQIARSKELGTAFVLIFSAISLLMFGDALARNLVLAVQRHFHVSREQIFDPSAMLATFVPLVKAVLWPLTGIFLTILVAAFVGNILLGGFNFSWEAARPKLSKMSPLSGFKRMFGQQALVELVKALLKFLLVALFAALLLTNLFDEILSLSLENAPGNYRHALELLLWMFLVLTFSVALIALVDAPYQKWHHIEQLKMTKQEIKDEHKNTEGSPEVKARIRRTQREMAQRRMMAEVPKADVVVTNPTHFAVALRYDQAGNSAPKVVAKGVDEVAMHIRRIARENNVPIVESPVLARSLYYTTDLDKEIPEQLFVAVAQVLAYVFQLNAYRKGKGKKPQKPATDTSIPPDYRY